MSQRFFKPEAVNSQEKLTNKTKSRRIRQGLKYIRSILLRKGYNGGPIEQNTLVIARRETAAFGVVPGWRSYLSSISQEENPSINSPNTHPCSVKSTKGTKCTAAQERTMAVGGSLNRILSLNVPTHAAVLQLVKLGVSSVGFSMKSVHLRSRGAESGKRDIEHFSPQERYLGSFVMSVTPKTRSCPCREESGLDFVAE